MCLGYKMAQKVAINVASKHLALMGHAELRVTEEWVLKACWLAVPLFP